jgi:hypothetical protein
MVVLSVVSTVLISGMLAALAVFGKPKTPMAPPIVLAPAAPRNPRLEIFIGIFLYF